MVVAATLAAGFSVVLIGRNAAIRVNGRRRGDARQEKAIAAVLTAREIVQIDKEVARELNIYSTPAKKRGLKPTLAALPTRKTDKVLRTVFCLRPCTTLHPTACIA